MSKTAEAVDVVVIGSGAAGSVFAATLAEAGKSVLILEGGRDRKPEDLYSSQTWSRRLKWGGAVIQTGPDSVWPNFNTGHGTGGSAVHHYAVWPRYHEDDFQERTLYGKALDWPFTYDELRPFYDQVQADVGMAGDHKLEVWRPPGDPYPLPPLLVTNHGRVLQRGFEAMKMRTSPIPAAILTMPYKGRNPCLWDGWCDAGCPIGALANPLAVYLPRASKAGGRLQANARVSRILTTANGKKVTGVEYHDTRTGELVTQPASAVALCAFTIENARVLLNSKNKSHPNGLSNGSGTLGRYLMSHPAVGITGMFNEDMQNFVGATGGQLLSQDSFPKKGDPGGAFGSRQWEIGLILKPNDLLGLAMSRPDIHGPALHSFLKDASKGAGAMVGVCEDEPMRDNRVELATEKDAWGMPMARVVYKVSADGLGLWKTAASQGVEIFKAAGAKEAWHGPRTGQHIMGGTIMGKDAKASVLNGNAQSHEVKNLFVGGPGVFPTSSSVNSTFTTHAMALKAARFMVQNWQSIVA